MKKIFLKLLPAAAILVLASSCDRTVEPDSAFISGSGFVLRSSGQLIYTYDPMTWQLGYNESSREFRASDDAMKNWFTVGCSKIPSSLGQKVEATVKWSSGSSTKSMKGKFEVVKAEGDTFWLWCGDKKTPTGVTVRVLR